MKNKAVKSLIRITRIAVFSSLALIMFFLESLLPPLLVFAPGAKMGLSNVVILLAVIILGYLDASVVMLVKCLLGSLFTNISSIMYSLPAGVLSLLVMILLYQFLSKRVSIMGISLAGAVTHNIVQCAVAAIINNQIGILSLLPLLLGASLIAGLFVGMVVYFVVKFLPKSVYI